MVALTFKSMRNTKHLFSLGTCSFHSKFAHEKASNFSWEQGFITAANLIAKVPPQTSGNMTGCTLGQSFHLKSGRLSRLAVAAPV